MLDKDLIVIDLEASGKDPTTCSIIQLGAVKFRKYGMIEPVNGTFFMYVKPYTDVWEEEAENIHHTSKDYLSIHGKDIVDVLYSFEEWVGNPKSVYLAMWSNGWDKEVLINAYKYVQLTHPCMFYLFSYRSYDIASFIRLSLAINSLLPKSPSLRKCAIKLGIEVDKLEFHNAGTDAQITALLLERIWNKS